MNKHIYTNSQLLEEHHVGELCLLHQHLEDRGGARRGGKGRGRQGREGREGGEFIAF